MVIKKILKIFLSFNLFVCSLSAQELPAYCKTKEAPISKKVKVNDFPSYFFKVHPSGEYIAYIGKAGNQLLTMESGETYPLPGSIDPSFTTDGKHLLVPLSEHHLNGPLSTAQWIKIEQENREYKNANGKGSVPDKWGMGVYEIEPFIDAAKSHDMDRVKELHSGILHHDLNSGGVYQSSSSNGNNLKILTDEDSASIKEYEISGGSVTPKTELKKICNQEDRSNIPTDIPMLSKDGKYYSAYDDDTKSTHIYSINSNGDCKLALDLKMATGKVSFNKDSSAITFHMDHFIEGNSGYFSGVASNIVKDVYVVKLDEKKEQNGYSKLIPKEWSRLTHNYQKGNGSYYPDFDDQDNVYFLSDQNNYFEFSEVKSQDIIFEPYFDISLKKSTSSQGIPACFNDSIAQNYFVLGQIWNNICKQIENVNAADSVLITMSLDNDDCVSLVTNNWNQSILNKIKDEYKDISLSDISLNDLLAACPENQVVKVREEVIGQWKKRSQAKFQDVLKQKCIGCHLSKITYKKEIEARIYQDEDGANVKIDKVKIDRTMDPIYPNQIDYPVALKLINAVTAGDPKNRMPKGSSLNDKELQLFTDMFLEKSLSLPTDGDVNVGDDVYPIYGFIYSKKKREELLAENIRRGGLVGEAIVHERKKIWCKYGQEGCEKFINEEVEIAKSIIKAEEPNISESALKEKLELKSLELKCEYVYDVIKTDCEKINQ